VAYAIGLGERGAHARTRTGMVSSAESRVVKPMRRRCRALASLSVRGGASWRSRDVAHSLSSRSRAPMACGSKEIEIVVLETQLMLEMPDGQAESTMWGSAQSRSRWLPPLDRICVQVNVVVRWMCAITSSAVAAVSKRSSSARPRIRLMRRLRMYGRVLSTRDSLVSQPVQVMPVTLMTMCWGAVRGPFSRSGVLLLREGVTISSTRAVGLGLVLQHSEAEMELLVQQLSVLGDGEGEQQSSLQLETSFPQQSSL
jgi:hypothetical protein